VESGGGEERIRRKNNEPNNEQAEAGSDGAAEPVVECVPNFSEGSAPEVFDALTATIQSAEGVRLLGLETRLVFSGHLPFDPNSPPMAIPEKEKMKRTACGPRPASPHPCRRR
jgi:hypothetical protein